MKESRGRESGGGSGGGKAICNLLREVGRSMERVELKCNFVICMQGVSV